MLTSQSLCSSIPFMADGVERINYIATGEGFPGVEPKLNTTPFSIELTTALSGQQEMGISGIPRSTGDIFLELLRLPRNIYIRLPELFADSLHSTQDWQVARAERLLKIWDDLTKQLPGEARTRSVAAMNALELAKEYASQLGEKVMPNHLMMAVLLSEDQTGAALFAELRRQNRWEDSTVETVVFDRCAHPVAKRRVVANMFGVRPEVLWKEPKVNQIAQAQSEAVESVGEEAFDANAVFKRLSERLSLIRKEKNLTIAGMARACKLSDQTLGHLLGVDLNKKPQKKTVVKLANGLGLQVTDLLPEFDRMYHQELTSSPL